MYRELVRRALAEDFGWGDVTTEAIIDRDQKARGVILAKTTCVMAGIDIAAEAFRQLDPAAQITIHCPDGRRCERATEVLEVRGQASALLTAERTALNFVQRLCGIATLTRQFVDLADGRITILDTRKTTPILRALEKYAVRAGGGVNHRSGLDDGILIKDNHVRLVGNVGDAVKTMRKANREMPTEVEAQNLAQVDEALEVAANAQRLGRGRLGRSWASPAGGGLYVSVVLHPRREALSLVPIAAGVAIAEGIEAATGLCAGVKWPNDVYVGTRKLAGILAEAGSSAAG